MSNYNGEFHFESWIEVEKMKQNNEQRERELISLWISEGHDPAMFPTLGEINPEDMEWAREQLIRDLEKGENLDQ